MSPLPGNESREFVSAEPGLFHSSLGVGAGARTRRPCTIPIAVGSTGSAQCPLLVSSTVRKNHAGVSRGYSSARYSATSAETGHVVRRFRAFQVIPAIVAPQGT